MPTTRRPALARTVSVSLLSLSVILSHCVAFAGPGDVNSVNDGQIITGGTYYNTPGSNTSFTNSAGTGLIINSGVTVTGLEVANPADAAGSLTGNGGWIHFNAPGQLVRVDGHVNVSGLTGQGYATANGGKVTVNAAWFMQDGVISAGGAQGGVVELNVGSMTLGPNARIDATGETGGQVFVNSTGAVDLQAGSIIDTSGKIIGNYDSNVIQIQGGLVNVDGLVRADGIQVGGVSTDGGKITLIATSGDIHIGATGEVSANGAAGAGDGGNGGQIILVASEDIVLDGSVHANGGNGADGASTVGNVMTVSETTTETESVGGFNHHAHSDDTALNGLKKGDTESDTIPGFNQTLPDGTLSIPTLTARATFNSNGTMTLTIKQGNTTLKTFTYDPASKPPFGLTHETVTFNATLSIPGQGSQTVAVTRDFNLQTSYNKSSKSANLNLTFLPQFEGGDYIVTKTTTHTEQTATGSDGLNGGHGGLISMTYGDQLQVNGSASVNGGNGGAGGNAVAGLADITWATAGNGGNGGNGGAIQLTGPEGPSGAGLLSVSGGSGGAAGTATADNASDGLAGDPGADGGIEQTLVERPPVVSDDDDDDTVGDDDEHHDDDDHHEDHKDHGDKDKDKKDKDKKDKDKKDKDDKDKDKDKKDDHHDGGDDDHHNGGDDEGGGNENPPPPPPVDENPNGNGNAGAGSAITPPGNPAPDNDVNALFQEYRFEDAPPAPGNFGPILLGMTPRMFRMSGYANLSQKILELALKEYNRILALGSSHNEADAQTISYLSQAGVDGEVAQLLLDEAADGNLIVDEAILTLLHTIVKQDVASAQNGLS
ncbi:MAG: hypothetical protein AB7P76_10490 [Candidatus Melainabacteria bacterium]